MSNQPSPEVLDRLYQVILSRRGTDPEASYSAKLFNSGLAKISQKLGEEAVETVIAAHVDGRDQVVNESADLLYHLLVLWAALDIEPDQVWQKLEAREGTSGLAEKAARSKS